MTTVVIPAGVSRWTYTGDDGIDYALGAKTVYVTHETDGAKYGGQADTTGLNRLPKGFKPRKVRFQASGKPDKWIVAYEASATIYTTPSTTLVREQNGVDVTYSNGAKLYLSGEHSQRDTVGIGH